MMQRTRMIVAAGLAALIAGASVAVAASEGSDRNRNNIVYDFEPFGTVERAP